jgi:hypothetical protein
MCRGRPDDTVARRERLAVEIVDHAIAERLDHADVLVPKRRPVLHPLVLPVVDVRAADPGEFLPHQDRAGHWPDHRILTNRDLAAPHHHEAPCLGHAIAPFPLPRPV